MLTLIYILHGNTFDKKAQMCYGVRMTLDDLNIQDPFAKIWLTTMDYEPNEWNAPIIRCALQENPRFMLIYGGERSGKSFNMIACLAAKLRPEMYEKKRLYWIVGPDYNASRMEFTYLFNIYYKLGLVSKVHMPESPTVRWTMDLVTNERWETRSSQEIAKLATFSINGALIVEANQQSQNVWFKIRGRVAENPGSFCILNGTYENMSDWFIEIYQKWSVEGSDKKAFSLPSWANSRAFPGGEENEEILSLKADVPESWYKERYAGIPSKASNLVIPEFEFKLHVKDVLYNPDFPVELAIDPGKKCYSVNFVQKVGDRAVVLDALYFRGKIAQKVIPIVKQHPLWKHVKTVGLAGAIDIAANAEPATISQAELWRTLAGVSFYSRKYPEQETIAILRDMIGRDMVVFSKHLGNRAMNGEAQDALAEFRLWKWREDDGSNQGERDTPIDRNNHFTKALAYWLLYRFDQVYKPGRNRKQSGANRRPNKTMDRGGGAAQDSIRSRRSGISKSLGARVLDPGRVKRSPSPTQ